MTRALLVTGATGKQGGSVVAALLQANADFEILALTRNPQSSSARKLQQKSPKIKLIAGDLDNVDEVFRKVRDLSKGPLWGVYSVQAAIGNGASVESELRQGKALIDASIKNGVSHFVYSSVDRGGARSDKDSTDVPHFVSKFQIEQHLFNLASNNGMDWTVLRPVAFFENLVPGFIGKVFATSWAITLREQQTLQLIATRDIGYFAAEAFLKPEEYRNRKITLAGDELTYKQFQSVFKDKTGQDLPTTFSVVAAIINFLVKDLGSMFKWFRNVGYGADVASLRELHPELKDFGMWLESESRFETHKSSR